MSACPCEWTLGTMMWLPFTSRTRSRMRSPSMCPRTSTTQGPAAFTIALARTSSGAPERDASLACQTPSSRRAPSKRVRVRIVAPFSRADIAFTTVSRESSTRQSEYTNPLRMSGLRPAPNSMCGKVSAFERGSVIVPPMWS